jgi:rhodanese-related sulfurtransferase
VTNDAPAGFMQGGLDAWKQANLPLGSLALVKPKDLYQQMKAGTAPVIVDVRLLSEWMGLRIGNVLNMPLNKLFTDSKRLSKDMPVLTVCNSAYRSSMGAAVLDPVSGEFFVFERRGEGRVERHLGGFGQGRAQGLGR